MKRFLFDAVWLWLLAGLALGGCPDKQAPSALPDAGPAAFAEIDIRAEAQGLLFTYLLADGSFVTVDQLDQVPEGARGQVIVVDTKLSPQKRRSSQLLYVADLSAKREDGSYPYSLVSRFKFERDLLRDPAGQGGVMPDECKALIGSPSDRVILYSTEWCGVCQVAARFMRDQGIPFEVKDVEKDPAAQRELACKALKAGRSFNGVPVLDVAGELQLGFDRDRIVAAARKLQGPGPGRPPSQP